METGRESDLESRRELAAGPDQWCRRRAGDQTLALLFPLDLEEELVVGARDSADWLQAELCGEATVSLCPAQEEGSSCHCSGWSVKILSFTS